MSFNDGWNLVLALLLIASLAGLVRLAFATPAQRRAVTLKSGRIAGVIATRCWVGLVYALLLTRVLVTWRRVTRNLELAKRDKLRTVTVRRFENGESVERERPAIAYPWVFPRVDAFGLVLTVWTRIGVGRAEWETAAEHLANTWRCRRVHVEQRRPGRITVRALRRDPLDSRLSLPIDADRFTERSNDNDQATTPIRAA